MSCSPIEQKEVILTRTNLIFVTVFVVLFIAFCDINGIVHGPTITLKTLG